MKRAQVYSVIPVTDPATRDDVVNRVYERYGYAAVLVSPASLTSRVRAHLSSLVEAGVVERVDGGYRRCSRLAVVDPPTPTRVRDALSDLSDFMRELETLVARSARMLRGPDREIEAAKAVLDMHRAE